MNALIGVVPGRALHERRRLFDTLSLLEPVSFEPRESAELRGLDGVVCFGRPEVPPLDVPALVFETADTAAGQSDVEDVELGGSDELDERLRGRTLSDCDVGAVSGLELPPAGDHDLARSGRRLLWARRGTTVHAAVSPDELPPPLALREALRPGRFLSVLPLIEFVREVAGRAGTRWTPPPARAAFVVDDPNLHATSYGYADFAAVAEAAEQTGYHVGFAIIPLDLWFAHPRAVRLFARHERRISLLIHGNDHVRLEFARTQSPDARERTLRTALGRVARFEQRTGLRISRVVTPPHGGCSEEMVLAMNPTALEAACISRPFPWRAGPPPNRPDAGLFAGDLVGDGFPIVPRYSLGAPFEDVLFRSYLDHPIVLYGHHTDLRDLEWLSDVARAVDELRPHRWETVGAIARSNYYSRRAGDTLELRVHSRHVEVPIEPGTSSLELEPAPGSSPELRYRVELGNVELELAPGERIEVPEDVASVAIRDATLGGQVPPTRGPLRPWPIARRVLTETRDRLAPLRRT